MEEVWKSIEGFEDYEVSSTGRVKSLKYGKERILKPSKDGWGYFQVVLSKDFKKNTKTVHVLVAVAFLHHKPCGYKFVVDHINDIPTDNRLENLQIVTQRENAFKTQLGYSSKYKGVYFHKDSKKWVSRTVINGKSIHLGLFINEIEAHEAYQNKIKTLKL